MSKSTNNKIVMVDVRIEKIVSLIKWVNMVFGRFFIETVVFLTFRGNVLHSDRKNLILAKMTHIEP
jgi:hypothetical protein